MKLTLPIVTVDEPVYAAVVLDAIDLHLLLRRITPSRPRPVQVQAPLTPAGIAFMKRVHAGYGRWR